ncbi:MAG TPA: hypothetical protein VMT46_10625, partial [Anaerolineaceae bacterium]|nr:hypothetical protein [Anaerolineaceae bacterium]
VRGTMKRMPMVLKALGNPPSIPAAELVQLLGDNEKEFVEYRFMSGWRAMTMITRLLWMQINPAARPPEEEYSQRKAFIPPIER